MKDNPSDIKTVVARVVTDKPVRKTPYQVKGVLMRQYPDEEIIPMLNGSYRDKYLYPRVQVKILNEQIYLIGIHEGAKPVVKICENLPFLFCCITKFLAISGKPPSFLSNEDITCKIFIRLFYCKNIKYISS